tara:strand:+ start:137 stop:412 length:276 start_codon:yes stop_codon:yes gene_type:complete
MEVSINALMDKLKQVKKLGIKNDFKNIDSKTYGKIILLVGDLDNVIEKYELDKMTGELKAWQDGSLINTDAINKLSLGDLERASKILEGVK